MNEFLNFLIPRSIPGFIFLIFFIFSLYCMIMMLLNLNRYKYGLLIVLIFILLIAYENYRLNKCIDDTKHASGTSIVCSFNFLLITIFSVGSVLLIPIIYATILFTTKTQYNTKNNYNTNKSK
jgi:hypothetical protein